MRSSTFGRVFIPEMVALSIAEMILTFALTLVLLTPETHGFDVGAVSPAIACAIIGGFVAFTVGVYRPAILVNMSSLLFNTFLSAIISFPAIWIFTKVSGLAQYWPVGYDSFRPIKIVAIWCGSLVAIRLVFYCASRLGLFSHRAALVMSDESAGSAIAARVSRKGFLDIRAVRPERASASQLSANGVRTLILPRGSQRLIVSSIRDEYTRLGIDVLSQTEFWETYLKRVDLDSVDQEWVDHLSDEGTHSFSQYVTRAFDLFASLALLLATLPLMCIIALLVRIDSVGPILYRQERLGLGNVPFTLFKFRSMKLDAEAGGPTWAQQKDPRVTRVGLFMRKTRIDELPQLLNILHGEMSFIGPRPERPHFVEQLRQVIPSYSERARVKPGLTGWAQVNFPYGASVEDAKAKLSYDLYYVKNRGLVLDLIIVLSTIRVILLQEGSR